MDTKKSLPESFTLTGRVTTHEDETDIELRSPTEKFTIAENVDDRFAPLFLAAPDMLFALENLKKRHDANCRKIGDGCDCGPRLVAAANAAIAKARGL